MITPIFLKSGFSQYKINGTVTIYAAVSGDQYT